MSVSKFFGSREFLIVKIRAGIALGIVFLVVAGIALTVIFLGFDVDNAKKAADANNQQELNIQPFHNVKPGWEMRDSTMGLWAFLGAFASGFLCCRRDSEEFGEASKPSPMAIPLVLTVSSLLISGLGMLALRSSGLWMPDVGMAVLSSIMGLVGGAFLYMWLSDRIPLLFPSRPPD